MARILIARFHSLGDVVLATGIADRLRAGGAEVVAATRPALRPVFEGLVPEVLSADGLQTAGRFSRVIDLQANATSRRLLSGLGPVARTRSRSFARRWIVFWGRRSPRPRVPHAVERYAEPAGLGGTPRARLRPRIAVTDRDREEAADGFPLSWERTGRSCIGLATGGSRRMKRWPEDRFARLRTGLEREGWNGLRFEPPDDGGSEEPGVVRAPLRPLKALLSRCRAVVTNDSGVMHLAVGLSVPVVALFGSTVREFGFAPLGPRDRLLEVDLACRPCAVHGARFCWQGHGACLGGIGVEQVREAVLRCVRERGNDGLD
ncbi:MAG: hypothetical protein GF346_02635 [Candidatus Eisenbacteria bacterium]|nr:hypothetical protein [Candidatus Latescibacterota bacterium]MBD3301317.1 hypothetical protein [Candidatus Eisenbacteria bacterium]